MAYEADQVSGSRDVGGLLGARQLFIPQGGPIPQELLNLLPGFEPH